ncbi:hypothetical protein [Mycobacterium scrofulaceum]|uniref:Uncharacterized protein n=1 Tax=Mycobacterium scrofulaceum TaxID=1783 RepID=A0A1X0JUK3_MYCSC|nr:hypothetical protein [Mycobacterium scrofulaceum]ORB66481.1 hypothetical protein BST44_28025 [Mycobacterium scrofulaceum]
MTICDQFGDVDARGATRRAQAATSEAEHQAIVRDVPATAHGQMVLSAGSNMASTDSAVGSSRA